MREREGEWRGSEQKLRGGGGVEQKTTTKETRRE